MSRHYSGPAEALLAIVEDDVLPGRRAGQRHLESHLNRSVLERDAAGHVGLAMADLRRAGERGLRCAASDPVRMNRTQAAATQRRVIGALHHGQRIAREVLGNHEPGRAAGVGTPADAEAAALPDGVALEPAVAAEHHSLFILDRTVASGQPAPNELAEGALADETDPGRVPLVRDRQAALACHPSYLGLAQAPERELAVHKPPRIQRVQKIALVLVPVDSAQEPAARADARIVAGREAFRAEPPGVLEADAELDLAIAEDVRIRRPPGLELGKEAGKHALAVLRLETRPVQRNAELPAHTLRVLEVGRRRAVAVVVFSPVRHEESLDVVSRVQEQGGRDRRVDATGEPDDDARHGISPRPGARRRRRAARPAAAGANGARRAGNRRPRPEPAGFGAHGRGPQARGGRARAS